MNSRWLILAMTLFALAACERSGPSTNSPTTANTPAPPESEVARTDPPFEDGVYEVCNDGELISHPDPATGEELGGKHLNMLDSIKIETHNGVSEVVLVHSSPASHNEGLPDEEVLHMVADREGGLSSVQPLQHRTNENAPAGMMHEVRIRREKAGTVDGCTRETVLTITFCAPFVDLNGKKGWNCGAAEPHLGDVHAQGGG